MRQAALMLILLAGNAYAEDSIDFECQSGSYWNPDGKVLVRAIIVPDSGFGLVTVADTDYVAKYERKGFNHRWDFEFNEEEDRFDYTFVIKPDGTGLYYDFSIMEPGKPVSPSQTYICQQSKQ